MPKVRVWAELSEEHLRRLQSEAERRKVPVEHLVELTVNKLIEDCERSLENDADHPIILC
jgi:3-methyladenine DNA glycosylase AlkC